ncbi:conserved Plasmodium protein, unknown function [Plasmodium ovale]|uniref:Uncharacterized protein n=1 Tax=Plasmodium ovale TaxID=36330 RepID=A0A1C3KUB8_PLAOA|nr:conserved Plasmodium protein, unknown function [Plasmodium ovale]
MKRGEETQEDLSESVEKKKKAKTFAHSYEGKKYIFCKRNNFSNLGGVLIEKNLFLINFLLSVKYNEEKKKKEKGEDDNCGEETESGELRMYYLTQGERVFINREEGVGREGSSGEGSGGEGGSGEGSGGEGRSGEGGSGEGTCNGENYGRGCLQGDYCNMTRLFSRNADVLLANDFFFYVKNYVHNTLSNVDICTQDKLNESFFEFFSVFKNKKKKIYFEPPQEDLLSDIYCDVSHASEDSDYDYFYEKANQLNDCEVEGEDDDVGDTEDGEVASGEAPQHELADEVTDLGDVCLVANLSKKLDSAYFQRRSTMSEDGERKKKRSKDEKFVKYMCRCCRTEMSHISDEGNCNSVVFPPRGSNVCLLQMFISNLTKRELLFWAQVKDCIEHFLGNIKTSILYRDMCNYVEIPYVEIMDKIEKSSVQDTYLKFVKKKKKIISLKKEQKSIKCLFEKTLNSVRISVKYMLLSPNDKFTYFFKDVIHKYKKYMKKKIFGNFTMDDTLKKCNEHSAHSIHNHLNPIVVKNYSKKNYDFSILVHHIHLEEYGYVYMRNYVFFLLIMTELYLFIIFNDISYTYYNHTDIFLHQILKHLFT